MTDDAMLEKLKADRQLCLLRLRRYGVATGGLSVAAFAVHYVFHFPPLSNRFRCVNVLFLNFYLLCFPATWRARDVNWLWIKQRPAGLFQGASFKIMPLLVASHKPPSPMPARITRLAIAR